jgi:hypothetical protein
LSAVPKEHSVNEEFQAAMREATRLTQAGRLIEATALIQRALKGAGGAAPAAPAQAPLAAEIIEGEFHVTEPTPTTAAPRVLPDASAAAVPLPAPSTHSPANPTPVPASGSVGERARFLSDPYTTTSGGGRASQP